MGTLRQKLTEDSGASMVAALLFFAFCAFVAASVLLSATSGMATQKSEDRARQAGYALRSAGELLRDDLAAALPGGLTLSAAEGLARYGCLEAELPEGAQFLEKDCGHIEHEYLPMTVTGLPEEALLAGPINRGMEALAEALRRWEDADTERVPSEPLTEDYTETFTIELPGDERFSEGCAVTAEFLMHLSGEEAGCWQLVLSTQDTGLRLVLSASGELEDGEMISQPGPVCTILYTLEGEDEPHTLEAPSELLSHTVTVRWDSLTLDKERQP